MSLRSRLFLLLVALAALLAAGEWWLIHTVSRDLRKELTETAAAVSQRVVQVFAFRAGEPGTHRASPESAPTNEPRGSEGRHLLRQEVRVIDRREVGDPDQPTHKIRVVTETGPDGKPEIHFLSPDTELPLPSKEDLNLWVEETRDVLGPVTQDITLVPPVPIPTAGLEAVVDRLVGRILAGTLALLALGMGLAAVVAHRVTAPLGQLVAAAERLGRGDLGTRVPAQAGGEVGRALSAFNAMSDRLRELDADARALRARQHLSELGEVGRGFAHSLRNPLNALGMAVDELARQAPDQELAPELAGRARRQIRRIDEALRAFLALGTDGGPAVTSPVDLGAVARDVALELAQSRPEGKETVRVEVLAPQPVCVQGLEAELRAAVQALVVNAVEASPDGATVQVRIENRPSASGDGARLVIDDKGAGLPDEVRRKLFTPHVTTKPAGAGMGLYLAHRVATSRYGGSLELSERPGGGTRATLELRSRAGETGSGAPSHG